MPNIRIVAVGTLKEAYWRDAANEYLKRLSRYAKVEIIEVPEAKGDTPKVICEREGQLLLSRAQGRIFLLDLNGVPTSSQDFAVQMGRAYVDSTLTFLIGGSHGVSDKVRAAAVQHIQFGRQTMPHQLVRVLLLEQIYRAFCILNGTPYHK